MIYVGFFLLTCSGQMTQKTLWRGRGERNQLGLCWGGNWLPGFWGTGKSYAHLSCVVLVDPDHLLTADFYISDYGKKAGRATCDHWCIIAVR